MSRKQFILLGLLSLFAIFIIIYNFVCLSYNCINSYDIGIYGEGLLKMGHQGDFNPWLTVRNINLFNDHFPLIMMLYGPIFKLFPYTPYNFIFLEYLWFLVTLILIYYLNKDINKKLFLMMAFIFCKGVLMGMMFPIHPVTWSMPILYLLVYSIYHRKNHHVVLLSLVVCLFREEIPFAILGLSAFYLINKNFKIFAQLFTISTFFIIAIFILRPYFIGPTESYGGPIIKNLLNHPIEYILSALVNIDLKQLKLFIPFAIPLGMVLFDNFNKKKIYDLKKSPLLATILLLFPIIILRILTNKFTFHYGPPLMVILIAILSFDSFWIMIRDHKRALLGLIFLFIMTSSSCYTKMFKVAVLSKHNRCIISPSKKESTDKVLKLVEKTVSKNQVVGSTGGIIAHLIRPDRTILHLGQPAQKVKNFDYLLLERNHSGDIWPLTDQDVEKIRNQCLKINKGKILYQDDYFLYLEGPLSSDCISVS